MNNTARKNRIRTALTGLAASLFLAVPAYSQWWSLAGNAAGANDFLGTTNTQDLRIRTNNTERMRILQSNGFVGIGNTNPQTKLHLNNGRLRQETTTDVNHAFELRNSSGGVGRAWNFYQLSTGSGFCPNGMVWEYASGFGSFIYPLTMSEDGYIGINIGTQTPINALDVFGGQVIGYSYAATNTAPISGLLVEGDVGIGQTSPSYKLDVNGQGRATGGWITSDARYKKDIASLDNALAKVMALKGVSYDFRRDEFPKINFKEGRQLGFIAQDVKEILPELVSQDKEGYYSVAYIEVVPLLVEAVKEQQQTIAQQNARIARLEAALQSAGLLSGTSDGGSAETTMASK
jgi:Chaperone of endosialidase